MSDNITVLKFRAEAIPTTGRPTPRQRVIGGQERTMDIDFADRVTVIFDALRTEMGGTFSVQEELLARRIAGFTAQLEKIETTFIFRDIATPAMLQSYEAGLERMSRAMAELESLHRRHPRHPLGPSPSDIHRIKRP